MGYGIILKVWGDYACFTRPELKVERVSYDMITPTAAKGIIEAIYWKPAINWVIDRIHVVNPIEFTNIRRNEVSEKMKLSKVKTLIKKGGSYNIVSTENRHQRAALVLKNVEYIIEAHFEMNQEKVGESDTIEKHYNIALRRLRNGQCFHHPCLGTREFGAKFELIEDRKDIPKSKLCGEMNLGYMLHSLNYAIDIKGKQIVEPKFFKVILENGVLDMEKNQEVVQ